MKYGAMNFPVHPVMEELEKIAGLGFDYIELSLDPPCAHYSEIKKISEQLSDKLRKADMEIICHLPTFVYTADLSPAIREASINEMLNSLDTAALIYAEKAVLHPSMISGLGPFVMEKALKHADRSLSVLSKRAENLGIQLCFENMFPKYHTFFSPDHFAELFNTYPNLMMTLDTGHANIDDPGQTRLFEFIRRFPDRIGHVHISDNNGKRDEHLRAGSGNINFEKFIRMLKETGYDDTITFEVFSTDTSNIMKTRSVISAMVLK